MIPASAGAYRAIRFTVPAGLANAITKVIFLWDQAASLTYGQGSGKLVLSADPLGTGLTLTTDDQKQDRNNQFMMVCSGQAPTGFAKLGEVVVGPDDAGLSVECPISGLGAGAGIIWMVCAVQATVGASAYGGAWNYGVTTWNADGLALVTGQ